ncbi:MAG: primosomal protein N' [Azonexus sp.]|jgi:primosomal protein N' (replication factor Y)|uniref:primosomal protein N' n=1 Tax=Azonexus sp. TaxID=1872668 RepID=UPI00282DDC91|nr:primosomal protein N' [Azonexus sp.]MDR0776262.1 primosomal protein N' [Azonexus sp.]
MPVFRVALDLPLHRLFDYLAPETAGRDDIGLRVRVPFGRGERVGVIIDVAASGAWPLEQLKAAGEVLRDLPPLPSDFFALCSFASTYYQAPHGEVVLQALPAGLKRCAPPNRRSVRPPLPGEPPLALPDLTAEQAAAVAAVALDAGFSVHLLYGVTGSGKTEVYLRLIERVLACGRQVLLLVPEINLTPQLEERVRARFPQRTVVALHSELAEAARERNWRAAFVGGADIVLGTRLAIFTPLPRLGLIVVDEEHDPSFKQQDGMRYSARDLAVVRARQVGVPAVLGSATPSLETWANAGGGRYRRLTLSERANRQATLPQIRILDTRRLPLHEGIAAPLLAAIDERLARGEQSLVFLNRRGYAPVLACPACGWVSHCRRCAANLVLHLADRRLRCHHCGFEQRIPSACPTCGNQDIHPFGRGTQRLEEWLQGKFPAARILRVDRDSVKSRKQWEVMLERIHSGEADILVGTQMLAKGHDFPKLTLVGVLGADAALYAADWRAPERLFAQLMQVAGRAGRAELKGEVVIQTQYPEHPLFTALAVHDYAGFAASQLQEREQAGFPPYAFQAVLRAEAPQMADAIAFLKAAAALPTVAAHGEVLLYDPVPMRMARLANLERGQLLAESLSRPALQAFLPQWREAIEGLKAPARLRWHLEVDPLEF